jgi:hypothetical protein
LRRVLKWIGAIVCLLWVGMILGNFLGVVRYGVVVYAERAMYEIYLYQGDIQLQVYHMQRPHVPPRGRGLWLDIGYEGKVERYPLDLPGVVHVRIFPDVPPLPSWRWQSWLRRPQEGNQAYAHPQYGQVRGYRFSISAGPLLLSVLVATAFLWWRDRSFGAGHCRNCGYDLSGNESGRCPECGSETFQHGKNGTASAGKAKP